MTKEEWMGTLLLDCEYKTNLYCDAADRHCDYCSYEDCPAIAKVTDNNSSTLD